MPPAGVLLEISSILSLFPSKSISVPNARLSSFDFSDFDLIDVSPTQYRAKSEYSFQSQRIRNNNEERKRREQTKGEMKEDEEEEERERGSEEEREKKREEKREENTFVFENKEREVCLPIALWFIENVFQFLETLTLIF